MLQQQADTWSLPRSAQLWSGISHDFNGLRRQRALEGSIDGGRRYFMTPGDAVKFNILSKRWNKWLRLLSNEPTSVVDELAYLAAANEKSIELRLGMAWKGLVAIAAGLALQKLEWPIVLGRAVRDLASYGVIGKLFVVVGWAGFVFLATYMLLNHFWRINASELRACVDLALLQSKANDRSQVPRNSFVESGSSDA